ncbi:hypothetical protein [Pseudostreptobacillus hongkongensis]|uniref:hypothetical protein n=1 Tax=Pseudostreptobacillus hongkongensis TaxID=1162717 RepID=UPI000829C193|nr:hypothetical protein [Pseudostreptobacillus hongkongensis]
MSYNITKKELIEMIRVGNIEKLLYYNQPIKIIERVILDKYDFILLTNEMGFKMVNLNKYEDEQFMYEFKTFERKRYEEYYYIYPIESLSELSICKKKDNKSIFNYYDFESGNYFETEEQAKAVLKDIKSIFDKVKKGEYDYES